MKKLFSALMSVILVVGLGIVSFAANEKITGQAKSLEDIALEGTSDSSSNLDVKPGDTIYIPLSPDVFDWEDEAVPEKLTKAILDRSKVKVSKKNKKNMSLAKDVSFVRRTTGTNSEVAIAVKFTDNLVTTKEREFEFTVYLSIPGNRDYAVEDGIVLAGVIANEEVIESPDSNSTIDLTDAKILITEKSARNITAQIGDGVFIHGNLVKNKRYYGVANISENNAYYDAIEKYSDIDFSIEVGVDGFDTSGDEVISFDFGKKYYVYDEDLKYLGVSNKKLPFSHQYYFAEKKLNTKDGDKDSDDVYADDNYDEDDDWDDIVIDEPVDADKPNQSGTSGSGGTYKGEANPGTGVPPLHSIAPVAGLLSLSVIGAVAGRRKKK